MKKFKNILIFIGIFIVIGVICIGIDNRNIEKRNKAREAEEIEQFGDTVENIRKKSEQDKLSMEESLRAKREEVDYVINEQVSELDYLSERYMELNEKNNLSDNDKNDIPKEYKSALNKANSYSDMMKMSKASIYNQLTSEYGEKFSEEAAQYAIENMVADWNANALEKAKSYSESMYMSKQSIYEQLISEYGEQFTNEEAQYAIDNLK